MKDVLEQQSKHLENLDNSAKKDTLIQLLQLREEMKIDKEDAEHLEKVKETNKILDRAVNIDINMAKDVKTVTEAVAGKEEIERKKQEAETFKELQKSVEKLTKILAKKEYLKKPENVESGNKTFGAGQKAPTKATGQNSKLDEQPLTAENVGEKLKSKRQVYRDKQAQEGSMLRRILVGQDKESVFEPMLKKREDAKADKKMAKDERKAAIKGAKENDPGTIGVGNFHGTPKWYDLASKYKKNKAMNDYAGAKYDALKEKEDSVLKSQDDIDRSKSFGYAPKVKDVKALKKASKEYVESPDNLAKNSQDRADARAEKAHAKEAARTEKVAAKEAVTQPPTQFAQSSEDKEEGKAERQKFEADTIISATKETEEMHGIGATLLASLAVHKDILQAIKEGGMGGGGSGGSMLDTAADLASNIGGKGKSMLGKAGKFLGKHAGKIGAIAGVAAGAYEAYEGWGNANKKQESANKNIDAKLESGEISKEDAAKMKGEASDTSNVEKGEAVGGGAGGAAGAWAGAATGAAIGSAVPIVGTAIGGLVGGAIGYYGGSKLGAAAGGALTKGYQGVRNFFGGGPDTGNKGVQAVATESNSNNTYKSENGVYTKNGKEISKEEFDQGMAEPNERVAKAKQRVMDNHTAAWKKDHPELQAEGEGSGTAGAIENKTNELNNVKDAAGKGSTGNIIAAPVTNISSVNTQNNQTRMPVRSEDNTLNRYIGSRYAPF
jgi:hypothetical protein